MSRRTHACLACPGRTRHGDQVCASCRNQTPDERLLPRIFHGRGFVKLLKVPPADPAAPTVAELTNTIDISCYLTDLEA